MFSAHTGYIEVFMQGKCGRNTETTFAIGADYSYEMKNSEIWAPAFFKHNNSFTAKGKTF